jgi:polyisoprenoid-binding protein YceI
VTRHVARIALALVAAAAPALAAESYVVEPGHTFPMFEVSHLGISTQRGRFERTTGRITLDRDARAGTVDIEIEAASASTGNPKLDVAVRGEDFFDAEHHPRIAFKSSRVEFDGARPARVEGSLTLLGVTRPVTLALSHFECTSKPFFVKTTCGADASATVSRAAFGMKRYASFIGDEVRIVIQVEAVKEENASPAEGGG